MKRIIYLCGAINGCTDSQAMDWRERVKSQLAGLYEFLDPMRRDYRGKEAESVDAIVEGDLADIDASDIILAAADVPSWGTAMEIYDAAKKGKTVWTICAKPNPSPWLVKHSNRIIPTLEDAIGALRAP